MTVTTIQKSTKGIFCIFLMLSSVLFFSCNSKNDLIGGNWKLQNVNSEFKINGKFEKIDSLKEEFGTVFNEISFLNEGEFNFTSKGITDEKKEITALGGAGFYKRDNNVLLFQFAMQTKSVTFKINSGQLIFFEDVVYEPTEPMILKSENNQEIKVTEIRNTYYYKK